MEGIAQPEYQLNNKNLSDLQSQFLDALFNEANGDIVEAARLAGYNSPEHNAWRVARALSDEILARTRNYLATRAPKAALALLELERDPTQVGGKERLAAIREVFDRGGLTKTERIELSPDMGGIVILPAKRLEQSDE